jgi:hypothetical protein
MKHGHTPLGSALKESRVSSPRSKSRVLISVSVLVPLLAGSLVLANSITISQNQGGSIEFGQGSASTSVCESNLNTELTSTFDQTAQKFVLESLIISGAGASPLGLACKDRIITVIPINTATPSSLATFKITPAATTETSYTRTPAPGTTILAENIHKILVQTESN